MKDFNFREYDSLKELFEKFYYKNLPIEDVEEKQDKCMAILNALEKYGPKKSEYVTARNNLLINAKFLRWKGDDY